MENGTEMTDRETSKTRMEKQGGVGVGWGAQSTLFNLHPPKKKGEKKGLELEGRRTPETKKTQKEKQASDLTEKERHA